MRALRSRACPVWACVLVLGAGCADAADETDGATAATGNAPATSIPGPDKTEGGTDAMPPPEPHPAAALPAAVPDVRDPSAETRLDSERAADTDADGDSAPAPSDSSGALPDADTRPPGTAATVARPGASFRSVPPAGAPATEKPPKPAGGEQDETDASGSENPEPARSVSVADDGVPVPGTRGPYGGEERTVTPATTGWGALTILKTEVKPGRRRDLQWTAGQSFAGTTIKSPVAVIRGTSAGPTLCLTAAIHGDELNGVEIVRRTLAGIDADELAGTLIGVPIVNMLGFSRGSRYLPDRRDLNRYFPGRPEGSSASRIAHLFYSSVMRHCDLLVDFHTGSFKRTNLPQLRADLGNDAVREFVGHFGATAVLHKRGARGTLRRAATDGGIPAVTFELGEPATLQLRYVGVGVKTIETLLDKLGMLPRFRLWMEPQPVFYRSHWLRAYRGGILTSGASVGKWVREGELLGTVVNPLTNEHSEIRSPYDGRLLGRALNQFVLPGFATFHIGIETQAIGRLEAAEAADSGLTGADDGDPGEEEIATAEPPYPDDPRLPARVDDELQDDELH